MCKGTIEKSPSWALLLKDCGYASGIFRRERENAHLGLSCLSDRLHREPLTRVVLHTAENDESDRRPLFFYDFQNILFSKGELPFTGKHLDDGIIGVEPM
jgi:hypothetical protein